MKMKKIISSALAMTVICGALPVPYATAEGESKAVESPYYEVKKNEITTPPDDYVPMTYVGEGRYIVEDKEANTLHLVDEKGSLLRDVTGSVSCGVMGYGSDYVDGLLVRFYEDKTPDTETGEDSKPVYVYNDVYEYINLDGSVYMTYTDTEHRSSKRPTGYNGGGYAVAGFLEGDKTIYYAHNLPSFHDGFAVFHSYDNDGYSFFDMNGKPITKDFYDEVFPFAGRAAVVKNKAEDEEGKEYDLCGLIGADGKLILPMEKRTIEAMDENWFNVGGKLYYLNENNELELKFSSDDIKAGKEGNPHTFYYAGEGIIGDCIVVGYMPQKYSYLYNMETKELIIPDAVQKFDVITMLTPYLSDGWNHLASETGANFYNSKGEKLVDTDKAVMYWDRERNYYVLRETTGENEYSYEIVNSKLETVAKDGMFICGDKYIGCDENGYFASSLSAPESRKELPYDYIAKLSTGTWSGWSAFTDIEDYCELFVVSSKDADNNVVKGVIDIEGNLLIENKYKNIDFTYQTGYLHAYTSYWDNNTHGYVTLYDDSYTFIPKKPETVFGDIDGNGVINAVDASKILVKCAELSAPDAPLPAADVIAEYDISGDGIINAVDASLVLAYCADLANDPDLKLADFIAARKNKNNS